VEAEIRKSQNADSFSTFLCIRQTDDGRRIRAEITTPSPLLIIVISKRAKAMLHSPLTDIAALLGASAFR
jgi:hypothetical protein